jgi:hypothetical protein
MFVTISDRMDITQDLVCRDFILISRIVPLSYRTDDYVLVREKRQIETVITDRVKVQETIRTLETKT